jgi:hypothetical protein
MSDMKWMDNLLGGKVEKEATLVQQGENKEAHENLKIENSNWVKEAMALDPVKVEAEYQAKLAEEAKLLGKTAAQDFKTPEQVIESDYGRQVKAYSDSNLMELLALARAHKDNVTAEQFAEYKETAKKNVESGRAKCEEELLKLTADHTLLDWKAAFKKFSEEAKVEQPKEKDLFPKVEDKDVKFDKPSENKFKMPTKEEMVPAGNGREADERKEVTKEAVPVIKEASKVEAAEVCPLCKGQAQKEEWVYCPKCKPMPEQEKKADEAIQPIKRDELYDQAGCECCPVCGGEGKDLKNNEMDHLSCMACGISYAPKEIQSCASKADVLKIMKTAEVASPWQVITDPETGKEVIARVTPDLTKESEEDKDKDLQK